ncbi:MAG TPA: hypothetical protein VGE74_18165 [Gemmata sp.]
MDVGAIIFVPALAGSAILGFVFLLFAAGFYLQVLEGTAAGAKEIPWQSESVTDNFTKVFYLAWLIGLWAGPAYLIGRAVAPGDPWLKLAVPLLVMWALYPASQLASLSASSIWVPLNLQVFTRLAQKLAVTGGFFVLSLPVLALSGVAFKWAFLTKGEFHLLFVGVPLLALGLLLYARLLGRLAFALLFTKNLLKRRKKKKEPEVRKPGPEPEPEAPPEPVQPSDMPPIMTPDGELAGYNVLIADDPPAPKKRVKAQIVAEPDSTGDLAPDPVPPQNRKRGGASRPLDRARTWTDEDDDATPYGMNAAEGKELEKERVPEAVLKPRADEMALLDRRDVPKAPKQVWSMELFAFLVQPGTISALLTLSALGVFAGAMVRAARAFDPTAGE